VSTLAPSRRLTITHSAVFATAKHPLKGSNAMTQITTHQAAEVAGYLKQWMFDPNHAPHALRPTPGFTERNVRNVNLKNSRERKFLQWEKQTFGINLGWTDNAAPETAVRVSRWFFTRPADNESPLRYGETVAMGYGVSPSYVHYAERQFGINLDWSDSPRFEWKLLGGPRGHEVRCGDWLAIYNSKAGDCLIDFDRTVGGDIGWPSSETWGQQIQDAVMKAIRDHWKEAVAFLLAA
jgi:hypothetical protein